MTRRGALAVAVLATLAGGCGGVRSGGTTGANGFRVSLPPGPEPVAPASAAELARLRADVVAGINAERRRAGRRPLASRRELELAAQRHAENMVARRFYSHDDPDGRGPRDRAVRSGYGPASLIGENIARGARGPAEAVALWASSPAHRRILLEARFSETGVGIAAGEERGRVKLYWVQLFAAPK